MFVEYIFLEWINRLYHVGSIREKKSILTLSVIRWLISERLFLREPVLGLLEVPNKAYRSINGFWDIKLRKNKNKKNRKLVWTVEREVYTSGDRSHLSQSHPEVPRRSFKSFYGKPVEDCADEKTARTPVIHGFVNSFLWFEAWTA